MLLQPPKDGARYRGNRAFRLVRVVLGLFLLAAAGLKLHGLSVSTLPPVRWLSSPWVQALAIDWEVLLGLWLLSGRSVIGSWLTAVGTFGMLAAISAYLGYLGQTACGCFGAINASPWQALVIDISALLALVVGRPSLEAITTNPGAEIWRNAFGPACFLLTSGLLLAAMTGLAAVQYGSPEGALARLRGESLTVRGAYIDFGGGPPGETLEANAEVRNWSNRPVRVIGGTSDCSCVATIALPMTIQPGESRAIPLKLKVPQSEAGAFTRTVELWTDCENQRTLWAFVGCRVE